MAINGQNSQNLHAECTALGPTQSNKSLSGRWDWGLGMFFLIPSNNHDAYLCVAQKAGFCRGRGYTFTPKMYPTSADRPIAMVPQITILSTALPMLEPPVLAETAPKKIRDRIVKP